MNVCDWSDATVVFANSTCFDDGLMRRMASAATALKKGTIFITLTKRLPVQTERVWLLYYCLKFMTPSRRIDVYIYIRKLSVLVCLLSTAAAGFDPGVDVLPPSLLGWMERQNP